MKQKLKIKLQGKISNRSNPTPINNDDQSENEVTCCATCHCTFVNFDAKDVINCNLCRDIKRLAGGYKNVEISEPSESTWKVKDEDGDILESCTTEKCVDSFLCGECGEHEDDCECNFCYDCGEEDCECDYCDKHGNLDCNQCWQCDNCDRINCEDCIRCENCDEFECDCRICDWCDKFECNCIICEYCEEILKDEDEVMYACECEDIVVP